MRRMHPQRHMAVREAWPSCDRYTRPCQARSRCCSDHARALESVPASPTPDYLPMSGVGCASHEATSAGIRSCRQAFSIASTAMKSRRVFWQSGHVWKCSARTVSILLPMGSPTTRHSKLRCSCLQVMLVSTMLERGSSQVPGSRSSLRCPAPQRFSTARSSAERARGLGCMLYRHPVDRSRWAGTGCVHWLGGTPPLFLRLRRSGRSGLRFCRQVWCDGPLQ